MCMAFAKHRSVLIVPAVRNPGDGPLWLDVHGLQLPYREAEVSLITGPQQLPIIR